MHPPSLPRTICAFCLAGKRPTGPRGRGVSGGEGGGRERRKWDITAIAAIAAALGWAPRPCSRLRCILPGLSCSSWWVYLGSLYMYTTFSCPLIHRAPPGYDIGVSFHIPNTRGPCRFRNPTPLHTALLPFLPFSLSPTFKHSAWLHLTRFQESPRQLHSLST